MEKVMFRIFLLGVILAVASTEDLKAECDVEPNPAFDPENRQNVTGYIMFTQSRDGGEVTIQIQLSGFNTSDDDVEHGFHVHEFGTISDATGCSSTGAHYNPESKNHGAPTATERHVGDLGNVEEDQNGDVDETMTDNQISLSGTNSIIELAMVIHANRDDLGLGGDAGSIATGNAGIRLACCTIKEVATDASTSLVVHRGLVATLLVVLLAFLT